MRRGLAVALLVAGLATCGDVQADASATPNACNARSTAGCLCVDEPDLIRLRAEAEAYEKLQSLPARPAPVATSAWSGLGGLLGALLALLIKALL